MVDVNQDVNIIAGTCNDNHEEQNDQESAETSSVLTDSTKEITLHSVDFSEASTSFNPNSTVPSTTIAFENETAIIAKPSRISWILSDSCATSSRPITIQPSVPSPPAATRTPAPSPVSLTLPTVYQPKTLFVSALRKINEETLNAKILHYIQTYRNVKPSLAMKASRIINSSKLKISESLLSELHAPDSLTNAPPSYSFVLRQMANRRRPTLMGTFIPSPSFVRQIPPPTYAAAFDIYVDNPVPPPTRQHAVLYGFTPMPIMCPQCGCSGLTIIKAKTTICTHLCAALLCVLCCWLCIPLPYIMKSCKDVYHYCRFCGHYLGMYCPTNPDQEHTLL